MNTYVIDEEAIKKAWGAEGQYWFDLTDYSMLEDFNIAHIVVPDEFSEDDILKYEEIIPFFNIKRYELARAYVKTIDNAKLQTKFDSLEDDEVVEYFWKCSHAYPELFSRIVEFQHEYILAGLKKWCENNNINYKVEL